MKAQEGAKSLALHHSSPTLFLFRGLFIPPPSNSVIHGKESTKWHDKVVQYIKEKGTVYAFHKKYGYGFRALVESQISRIKKCIGGSLKTQGIESQEREGVIIANNKWNSFGKCICVNVG